MVLMKIAVVGAGFAGLATCYYLLQTRRASVTLFDKIGIGAGASGMAAGLLHPFVGKHARMSRYGLDGFMATCQLLEVAEKSLGCPVSVESGILRLPNSAEQLLSFRAAVKRHSDMIVTALQDQVAAVAPGAVGSEGIFIKAAHTVYIGSYLQGLWLACQNLGAKFCIAEVSALSELSRSFDIIIYTVGANSGLFTKTALPLSYIKGQMLQLRWPNEIEPLQAPLTGQVYCVMERDEQTVLVGSTYERNYTATGVDLAAATGEIYPKLGALHPRLCKAELLGCRAGIRVSTPDRLPLLMQLEPHCWLYTGLGSRGLLYHALYGKFLTNKIFPPEG